MKLFFLDFGYTEMADDVVSNTQLLSKFYFVIFFSYQCSNRDFNKIILSIIFSKVI